MAFHGDLNPLSSPWTNQTGGRYERNQRHRKGKAGGTDEDAAKTVGSAGCGRRCATRTEADAGQSHQRVDARSVECEACPKKGSSSCRRRAESGRAKRLRLSHAASLRNRAPVEPARVLQAVPAGVWNCFCQRRGSFYSSCGPRSSQRRLRASALVFEFREPLGRVRRS